MLKFFRRNKVNIVVFIVISFIVTTILGTIFYNQSFNDQPDSGPSIQALNQAVAKIGDDILISNQLYQLELQRLQASIPTDQPITSTLVTHIQLQALTNAVNARLFLEAAEKNNIKATKKDVESFILPVYDQYNVSTKKELKSLLKQIGGSYNHLVSQLKDDIKINKMQSAILNQVALTDEDKQNINQLYTIRAMFFSNIASENTLIADESLRKTVDAVRTQISDSESFVNLMTAYLSTPNHSIRVYQNPISIRESQLIPDIIRVIRTLHPNEISSPIAYMGGYAIVELIEQSSVSEDQLITEEDLLVSWKNLVKNMMVTTFRKNRPIQILDLPLKALHLLNNGQFDEAILVYQQLSSQDPSNPIPHLYIAQVYLALKNLANAKQEALKAEIKASILTENALIPDIYFLLATIYEQEGLIEKQMMQLDTILDRSEDIVILEKLRPLFESDQNRLEKLNKKIDGLESRKEIQDQLNPAPLDLTQSDDR